MSAIQKRLAKVGIAKQTVKGTAISTPQFGFGIRSGSVFGVELQQEREAITLDNRVAPVATRLGIVPGVEFTTRLYPKSIGLLMYGVLGAISTSGSGNYTHTITPFDDLPYLTLRGLHGTTEFPQVRDCKVDELGIKWSKTEPPEVDVKLVGAVMLLGGTTWTPTVDDSRATFLPTAGGTFKLDSASSTPVVAPVSAGEIKISNNLEPIMLSASIEPDDVFPAEHVLECSFTLTMADFGDWRETITGSASGTTSTPAVVYGSFDMQFTIDANTSLQLVSTRVAYTADFPDADPAGGPSEIMLNGAIVLPAAGAAITATLKNQQASY